MRNILIIALISISFHQVIAQTDSTFLVLNTRMHNKTMTYIEADKSCKYIITSSMDKTAKLWDANTGNLLLTYRVPIDQFINGEFMRSSISPDNKLVAFRGIFYTDSFRVFIFDLLANKIEKIINLENPGFVVKFSKNGKFLALGQFNGILIYETKTWNLIKSDTDYQHLSLADLDFDQNDNLVTIDYNGNIRFYNSSFELKKTLASSSGVNGINSSQVIFSPDSKNIYVNKDSFQIMVLESKSLKVVFETDFRLSNVEARSYYDRMNVTPDNKYLVLNRVYTDRKLWKSYGYLTYWSIKDYKVVKEFNLDKNYFERCCVLNDNSVVFYSSDYRFGRITMDSAYLFNTKTEDCIEYSRFSTKKYFRTNENGNIIGNKPNGLSEFNFNVKNRSINIRTTAGELPNDSCSDYKINFIISESENISLKSHNVKLGSAIRTADISSDRQRIAFAEIASTECYDSSGKKLWHTFNEDDNAGVNISGNGKVVVVSLQSGIFQWIRMTDGKVLLNLYIRSDMKRWMLWTPKGYFDCAPGAEDLIGWHVNQGFDKEPLFYPLSKFRDKYYRPDIIDLALEVYDEDEAIRLANVMSNRSTAAPSITQMLPPQVNIISPEKAFETSSNSIKIKYSVSSANKEPVTSVKILIDGRPCKTAGYSLNNESDEMTVTIPSATCKISIIAENRFGFSVAADLDVKWKAIAPKVENIEKPTLYILAIGISNYKDSNLKLGLAAKDAEDFAKTLEKQKGFLYKDVQLMLLNNDKATRSGIIEGLEWLQTKTTAKDVAMIFMAGHGVNDVAGAFYFLPYEADVNKVKSTALLFAEIKITVSTIPGKVIVFADACHSGNIMGTKTLDVNGLVNSLSSSETGAIVFTSSTGRQFSLENKAWENGAFTKALIEGFSGKADFMGKGNITIKSLDLYVSERVKELTDGQQTPTTIVPVSIPDFALTTLR